MAIAGSSAGGEPQREVPGRPRRTPSSERWASIAAASVPTAADERAAEDDRREPVVPAAQAERRPGGSPQGDENRPDDLHRRRSVGRRDGHEPAPARTPANGATSRQ